MIEPFVICDHQLIMASLVPTECYGSPGLCPDGIYDTMLWDGQKICNLRQHLTRFASNCQMAGLNVYEYNEKILKDLSTANNLTGVKCRIRIMSYRQPRRSVKGDAFTFLGVIWKIANPITSNSDFRCEISQRRRAAGDATFQLKRLGLEFIDRDLIEIRSRGLSDILYFNDREEVCEASYSNIWIYNKGILYTPPTNSPCLPGITRHQILKCAGEVGIPVRDDHPVDRMILSNADEIFLSSSIRGIQPVTEISGLNWKSNYNQQSVSSQVRSIIFP